MGVVFNEAAVGKSLPRVEEWATFKQEMQILIRLKEENPSLQSDELLLPGEAEVRLPDLRCHRVG